MEQKSYRKMSFYFPKVFFFERNGSRFNKPNRTTNFSDVCSEKEKDMSFVEATFIWDAENLSEPKKTGRENHSLTFLFWDCQRTLVRCSVTHPFDVKFQWIRVIGDEAAEQQ